MLMLTNGQTFNPNPHTAAMETRANQEIRHLTLSQDGVSSVNFWNAEYERKDICLTDVTFARE